MCYAGGRREEDVVNGDDGLAGPQHTWEIPAAFYREEPPPFPAPGDPHRVEFYAAPESAALPNWMLLGLPILALIAAALHAVVAVVLLLLLHQ
jgi:hypothetical protein